MNLNKKIKPPQKGMIDFTRGARTAIYKPVLLKSILTLSIIINSPKIDINEIMRALMLGLLCSFSNVQAILVFACRDFYIFI